MWDDDRKIPGSGILLEDGDRVGLLFYTGRLVFATYSKADNSLTFEDDGAKVKMHPDYLHDIRRWLEK